MVTINKLIISGLRNFGTEADDVQSIKFGSPLTLILGENGCGKTTIIEALNFACSGEMPVGSKNGQGFVNDPKLNTTATTKGQLRLCLTDLRGCKYILVKSMQLTNKGATSTFKRLDSTLKRIKPDGTSKDISSRCGDFEIFITELLSVPKAILSNVIFCHQENSSWPLDEPKKLKEKFDEIFGADKYNKCSENILKRIKIRRDATKMLSEKVKQLEITKTYVDKKRSDLEENQEKLTKWEAVIQEKNDSLVPIRKRLQDICDLEININELQRNCAKKEAIKQGVVEQQNTILKNIEEEYGGSDEALQNEIVSFETNRKKINDNLIKLQRQKRDLEVKQKELSKLIDQMQIKLGKLQSEKSNHLDTVKERNNLIKETANNFDLELKGDLNVNENVSLTLELFNRNIKDYKNTFETVSRNCDEEEKKLQNVIDTCRDKLNKVNHSIESKGQQIGENKKKIREIDSSLHELNQSDQQLDNLRTKIDRVDTNLKNLKESFDNDAISKSIETDKRKIREHEENIESLEKEYKLLQQNYATEAAIESQKQDLGKRESEIHKLKNKHFENFSQIFDEVNPNLEQCKQKVEIKMKTNLNKVNDLTKKITLKQKEVTTLETRCKFQKDKLKSLEQELKQNEQQVNEVCQGKPFDKMSTELHQIIEKLQKDKGQYSSAKTIYEKFLQEFEKPKPCCPVCQTGFSNNESAVHQVIANIRKKIQGIPAKLLQVEEDLKSKQKVYNDLLQLKPVNKKIEELRSNLIPKVQEELSEINNVYTTSEGGLNNFNQELIAPQNIVDICNRVVSDAALIDQYQRDIKRAQDTITQLESQIVQVASNRSRQQTEAEIDNLKLDLTNIRRTCELSQKKLLQHNDRCQELVGERNKLVERQLQLQKAMQGKPQLEEQLTELKNTQESLTADIVELQIQLAPINEELTQAKINKEDTKKSNRKKINETQNRLYQMQKRLDEINKLHSKVQQYIRENKDGKLEGALEDHAGLKEKETSLKESVVKIDDSIADVNKQLATQDGGFRTLQDNKSLRDKRREEQTLLKEIAELKTQIGNHNVRTLLTEKQRLQQEYDDLRNEIAKSSGRSVELKQAVDKSQKELNLPENKRIYTAHKNMVIEYTISKHMLRDLEKYLNRLDYAILQFHQERIAQVNKIIRHLWRSIYKGNDIDYIEIKTDEIKSVGNKRAYNYKIVQMKMDAEIDMRGRCSAGQRVLACLIIRIALAETFSKNCGILALDEPTTNLDRANIKSLCDALARLVKNRQSEKNFQLLIITHDEEFLTTLNRSIDNVHHFWRVTRNDKGNSVITQELLD